MIFTKITVAMKFILRKQINYLSPLLKNCTNYKLNLKSFLTTNSYKRNIIHPKPIIFFSVNLTRNQIRNVSSSSFAKANDNNNSNGPRDDRPKNILIDDDFQSILSDFAKDFGVSSESEPLLDEIRKSLDEDYNINNEEENRKSNSSNEKSIPHPVLINDKFKEFSELDSVNIPSSEEIQSYVDDEEHSYHIYQDEDHQLYTHPLKRGVYGVYDIDELIKVLQKENLEGITAISVPKELHYTDFLVIVTAKSPRHSKAVCEKIIKLYKQKKNLKDPFVVVEGEKTSDWKAIDMGNIVLHIFLEETRALYDIESLWLFDSEFDKGGNQKLDPLYGAIEEQMSFFKTLTEAISKEPEKK